MSIESRCTDHPIDGPSVVVLGTAQDGGYPQAGCRASCCQRAWDNHALRRYVACLGIFDPLSKQQWMIDCTPDFRWQYSVLTGATGIDGLDGILLTHAHVGHYTGLINLGNEMMNADSIPLFVMPRMNQFLRTNRPWNSLVESSNVDLRPIGDGKQIELTPRISVKPMLVPHRDEDSETVGFLIAGPQRRVLYLPDIDDWEKWDRSIETELANVDVAFLDGSFFSDEEIPGRNLSTIAHPTITSSMNRLAALPTDKRQKVRFVHLNHTNPAINPQSDAAIRISQAGHYVAVDGEFVPI